MLWDASSVMYPEVIPFSSFQTSHRHTAATQLGVISPQLAAVDHGVSLSSQSHLVASVTGLMALSSCARSLHSSQGMEISEL